MFAGEKNILDSLDDEASMAGKPKFCDFNGIATIGKYNYKVFCLQRIQNQFCVIIF